MLRSAFPPARRGFAVVLGAMCWVLAVVPHSRAWQSDLERAQGRKIAVNAQGDVFAAGVAAGVGEGDDFVVEKLSSSGARLWLGRLTGPMVDVIGAYTAGFLALDPAGDVLAGGGMIENPTVNDWTLTVAKLDDATGAELWRFSLDTRSTGIPFGAAADAAGDVFVVGEAGTGEPAERDGVVLKLDGATGGLQWATYVSGVRRQDHLDAVAVLPDGDVGVAGQISNQISAWQIVVARIASADGAVVWRMEHEGDLRDFAVDSAGRILVACNRGDWNAGDFRVVVRQLDAMDGSIEWESTIGGLPENTNVFGGRLALTSIDDVIVGFGVEDPVSDSDVGAVKLAGSDGQESWRTILPGPSQSTLDPGNDWVTDVAIDSSDNVYLTGSMATADTSIDGFVHKLDPAGAVVWSQALTSAPPFARYAHDEFSEMVVAPSGDPVVVGTWNHRNGEACCLDLLDDLELTVIKLDGADGAYTRPVAGTAINLLTGGTPRLKMKSRDTRRIAIATRDTPAEPTVSGATLTLLNPTTHESSTYTLPPAGWTVSGSKRRYRYRDDDQTHGPCRSAVVSAGKMLFNCRGNALGFTLDEPSQGALAVVMAIGAPPVRHCALFSGSAITSDTQGQFVARKAPATIECPVSPP